MISKELLSEVLKKEAINIINNPKDSTLLGKNEIIIVFDGYKQKWNIYELAHKCKEWAFDKDFSIVDGIDEIGNKICYIMKITGFSSDCYYEQTENFKDVFKACEWIINNKKINS